MSIQIKSLTPLRGIAAMLVVLHSYTVYLLPDIGEYIEQYSYFVKNGYLWVDFFFILSGFVLAHVYGESFSNRTTSKNYIRFVISRFARIYPLHIFVLGLFVLFELASIALFILQNGLDVLLTGNSTYVPFGDNHSVFAIFTNILLLQAVHEITTWNEPAWSISAEWIAYLLFPFLASLILKRNKEFCAVIYLIVLVALFALIEMTKGHLDFAGYPSFIRCILESSLGITLYKFYQYSKRQVFFSNSLLFCLVFFLLLFVLHEDTHDIVAIPLLSLVIILAANNSGFVATTLESRPMSLLGDLSYSIYMTHWFIQYVTIKVWSKLFNTDFGSGFSFVESLAVLMLYFAIVIFVSWITFNTIERPMRQKIKDMSLAKRFF